MNINLDELMDHLPENIYLLVDKYFHKYLRNDYFSKGKYYSLDIIVKVTYKEESIKVAPAKVYQGKKYLKPRITIRWNRLLRTFKHAQDKSELLTNSKFLCFVLFHELAHIIEILNDIENRQEELESQKTFFNEEIEALCDSMAKEFLYEEEIFPQELRNIL